MLNKDDIDLSAVTAVRFLFNVDELPRNQDLFPASDGMTIFDSAGDVDGRCITRRDTDRACHLLSPLPPPQAPPPPPPPPPPDGGEACGYPEFLAHSQEVTAACCDEAGECELLTCKAEEADKLQVEADGGASNTDQDAAAEADTPSGSS